MIKIEKTRLYEGRKIRFSNFLDEESLRFESEAAAFMAKASLDQTLAGFTKSRRKIFVMQMRGLDGAPAMQACVSMAHPPGLPFFAMATAPKLWSARDSIEEEIGLRALKELCREIPWVMTLRLQPERFEWRGLMDFQAHAVRSGYQVATPIGMVRTRLIELGDSDEALKDTLPRKTKVHLRHSGRDQVEIRRVFDRNYIASCLAASAGSWRRVGEDGSNFDFERAFALAATDPGRACILGLFLKSRPADLVAYAIGFRRESLLEYASAGALFDPELRTMPFNYFLVWELISWGRKHGCTQMDVGGVSDGGPADPLKGIARFKRAFPGQEIETGREMFTVLRPALYFIYQSLKTLQELFVQTKQRFLLKGENRSEASAVVAYD